VTLFLETNTFSSEVWLFFGF